MSFFDYPIYQPAQDYLDPSSSNLAKSPIGIFVNADEYTQVEEALLSKIIGATGNTLSDLQVQALKPQQTISLQSTWDNQKGLDVIFGVSKDQLMLQCEIHMYYPIHLNLRTLLFCDSLTILSPDAAKKNALWGCLKAYFNI